MGGGMSALSCGSHTQHSSLVTAGQCLGLGRAWCSCDQKYRRASRVCCVVRLQGLRLRLLPAGAAAASSWCAGDIRPHSVWCVCRKGRSRLCRCCCICFGVSAAPPCFARVGFVHMLCCLPLIPCRVPILSLHQLVKVHVVSVPRFERPSCWFDGCVWSCRVSS